MATTHVISANRAGHSAVISENNANTHVLANPAVVTESAASAFNGALSDSVASSDSFTLVTLVSLADTISSSDGFFVDYNEALSDSAASSDSFTGNHSFFAPLSDSFASSDSFTVLSAFAEVMVDSATSFDVWGFSVNAGAVPECGPIVLFPTLPAGFPMKLSLVMDTTIGTTKSLREMRVAQQAYPLWDIELPFEELRDETQNQSPYVPFYGMAQYMELVQLWLMMYGKTGVFGFQAPWDCSRTNQVITTNSTSGQTAFPVFETWGTSGVATEFPIGLLGSVSNVSVNGVTQSPSAYYATRSYINFNSAPAPGSTITMTFQFYYLCRFTEDEQDFDEFSKNRWQVPSLKFRAVYWPGCQ